MKWNYNYGRFADAVYPGYPRDKQNIMKNPENLESGILGFLSALWIYMSPRSPMPSMHEIATGFFKPNQHDELSQIFPAFGATTNIFNGNKECNVEFGTESDSAYHRAQIYLDMLTFFNLHPEYHLGCSKMGPFPEEGFAAHAQYFTKGVKPNSCDLVSFPTAYSLYNLNDYKRCVCESWMIEEENCVLGDAENQKRPAAKEASDSPLDKKIEDEKKTTEPEPKEQDTKAGEQPQDKPVDKKEAEKKEGDETTAAQTGTEAEQKEGEQTTTPPAEGDGDQKEPASPAALAAKGETPNPDGGLFGFAVNAAAIAAAVTLLSF